MRLHEFGQRLHGREDFRSHRLGRYLDPEILFDALHEKQRIQRVQIQFTTEQHRIWGQFDVRSEHQVAPDDLNEPFGCGLGHRTPHKHPRDDRIPVACSDKEHPNHVAFARSRISPGVSRLAPRFAGRVSTRVVPATMIPRVMLRLFNLTKRFGTRVAVDDLSLTAEPGEILGFLGPNGAGKSTTINMVAGLLKPDGGHIEIDGAGSPDRPEVRRRIGVAPQALAIYDELSAQENLTFFGKLTGLSGDPLRERVHWALDFVALSDRRHDRIKTYSGGMKRRLNLAVALVHDPPLLLLDEPTVGVDPQSRNAMFEKIVALKEAGHTIVYTTHYMEEAQRMCDRVGIIDNGRILAMDRVDQLIETHGGKSVVTVQKADGEERIETNDPLEECVRLQREGDILSLRVDRPSLETVFLNLTGRALRD